MASEQDSEQDSTPLLHELKGAEFFSWAEKAIQTEIPNILKLIFQQSDIKSAAVFARLDDKIIGELEEFVRNDLIQEMLPTDHLIANYLGVYAKCQAKFKFLSGQKVILKMIIDKCKAHIEPIVTVHVATDPLPNQSKMTSLKQRREDELNTYEVIEQLESDTKQFSLFNYIGSLMINVFNDAKRLTLSAWSWPSRHYANEKAAYFKATGKALMQPTLNYVTPSQHKTFLNCIVESHKPEFVEKLENSWASSVRVDGSCDRTQDHNVYVLEQIVNKDATVSTSFIGFQIPKAGKSLGYFECVKSVVQNVWNWDRCLALTSSLVTDGEPLNTGSEQGLWARFVEEVRKSSSRNQPIICIHCIPHRFNLAWKDTCKDCSMITDIVSLATSLSSHFHHSADRTQKMRNIATLKNLKKPLRYVTHFDIRWTEHIFELLDVTLRNWRPSMAYFKSENDVGLANRWLLYDRLHFLTFVTDIVMLVKKYQKTFESDTVNILNLEPKKNELFDLLKKAIQSPVSEGWEELFLTNIEVKADGKYFYGHKLLENNRRSAYAATCVFNISKRKHIIASLCFRLTKRLDSDIELRQALHPLLELKRSTSYAQLHLCYSTIVPDCDENTFISEYGLASDLLAGHEFTNPLKTLQKLHELVPENLQIIQLALARIVAAKPHSADVERLINDYNKLKATDRTSLSGLTLFDYLYVKVNMMTVSEFDPSVAVNLWMDQKNRTPHESSTRTQQEYFKDVFPEADQHKLKYSKGKIEF